MRANTWQACSFELAVSPADQASKALAHPKICGDEKLEALGLMAGCEWNKPAMRKAPVSRLSGLMQRAVRNPKTKEVAANLRRWLHAMSRSPPQLAIENPNEWRSVVAT